MNFTKEFSLERNRVMTRSASIKGKRVFDLLFVLILSPIIFFLLIFISSIIKITSKGPVIFSQIRVGKDGKLFKMYKFRTMHENAEKILFELLEKDPQIKREWLEKRKLKNDPRITKVGRFLRKTSLDELPQFINVIKGEMSLVGPRPYLPSEIQEISEFSEIILSVNPGITGLWQVNGRSDTSFRERIILDLQYIGNISLILDLKILIKTVKVVLRGDGAY